MCVLAEEDICFLSSLFYFFFMLREGEHLCMKRGAELEANFLMCKGVCSCTDGGWVTSLVLPLSGNEQDFRAMESI